MSHHTDVFALTYWASAFTEDDGGAADVEAIAAVTEAAIVPVTSPTMAIAGGYCTVAASRAESLLFLWNRVGALYEEEDRTTNLPC